MRNLGLLGVGIALLVAVGGCQTTTPEKRVYECSLNAAKASRGRFSGDQPDSFTFCIIYRNCLKYHGLPDEPCEPPGSGAADEQSEDSSE